MLFISGIMHIVFKVMTVTDSVHPHAHSLIIFFQKISTNDLENWEEKGEHVVISRWYFWTFFFSFAADLVFTLHILGKREMTWTQRSHNVPFLATPHSALSVFTRGRLSGRQLAQGPRKKYKQSQHGEVKGEESPPPTTVGTHFRLGLHVKSHPPLGGEGWRGIHCLGMGQWVCVIKSLCSYKWLRLLDQVSP